MVLVKKCESLKRFSSIDLSPLPLAPSLYAVRWATLAAVWLAFTFYMQAKAQLKPAKRLQCSISVGLSICWRVEKVAGEAVNSDTILG